MDTSFHSKDTYIVQSILEETFWYNAYLVKAKTSGQFFSIVAASGQKVDDINGDLQRAARIMGTVDSPYIVKAHDVNRDGDSIFVVLENLEGIPLIEWNKKHGQISEFDALRFLKQMAMAVKDLEYFHIEHTNIRPSSIYVSPDPANPGEQIFKLWDLSLSTLLTDQVANFQAPEKVWRRTCTVATDIYSIGAVTYWLLTGREPYEGQDSAQVGLQIISDDPAAQPAPLGNVRPDLTKKTLEVIGKCMAHHVKERYRSASQLISDVDSLLSGLRDEGEFLFERARVAVLSGKIEDLKEVLRIAKRIEHIPGARRRFSSLEREAQRKLEEQTEQEISERLNKVKELISANQFNNATSELDSIEGQLTRNPYLRTKQVEEIKGKLLEQKENLIQQRRFKPAYLQSSATEETYELRVRTVSIVRTAKTIGDTNEVINLIAEPEHSTVSGQHAELRFQEGQWLLICKKTTNKNFVNGNEIHAGQTIVLEHNTKLKFGKVELTFHFHTQPDGNEG